MSVRSRKWKDPSGKVCERWVVDVQFEHPSGRIERVRKFSPVNTRRGAEEYERQIRASLLAGTFGKEAQQPAAPKTPTLSEFEDAFITYAQNNNKPSQVFAKKLVLKNHLIPAFGDTPLDQIKLEQVEAYKARKLKGPKNGRPLSPKTVNNHLAMLRKALNLAVEMGKLDHAPRFKMLRAPRGEFAFLDFDEADRLIAASPPEWKVMVTVAIKAGLRSGELMALKWEDLDLKAGRLIVRRTVWNGIEGTPKGGRSREVPLPDSAVGALAGHRHLKGPYVFCGARGEQLTHSVIKDIVPRICARAGLPKRLTWHGLRHTYASHLVMRGVPLAAVKELLGHADVATTMIYAHLSPDVKRDAVRLLDAPRTSQPGSQPSGTCAAHEV